MRSKNIAVLMMVLCTVFTSIAQVFYKKGANILEFSIKGILTDYYLYGGILLYVVGAVIMIYAFRKGEVTVLYPIITLSYVWVSLLSIYFFDEVMNPYKWTGVMVIIMGISLIGIGSNKNRQRSLA